MALPVQLTTDKNVSSKQVGYTLFKETPCVT